MMMRKLDSVQQGGYVAQVPVPEAHMRTYPLNAARAEFSKLVDRALAGEPQRVTRYGKDAVVIVSEEEWNRRPQRRYPTLGHLLADFAERGVFGEDVFDRSAFRQTRPLGGDFLKDE
jgi:prevent-host-death family protein